MASMKYCDKHNQVGFLKKPEESAGFAEIVDFLKGSHIRTKSNHRLILRYNHWRRSVRKARTMTVEDLLHLVPNLITMVVSLETELKQTKLTMGKEIVKLVKKVKKLEAILKRRHVVLTDSEDEEPED
ncbi:hypothetical protein Tco_0489468 [Tanacetum coccineum]